MEPKSFQHAWTEAQAVIRAQAPVLLPVAGAFIFLPQLIFGMANSGLVAGEPIPADRAWSFGLALGLLVAASLFAQLVVTMIGVGDRRGQTLGAILLEATRLLASAVGAAILQAMLIFIGLVLLVLPGLWLMARLVFTTPALVSGNSDPIAAMKTSWEMTEGASLRILGQILALVLGFLVVSLLVGGIGAALGVLGAVAMGDGAGGIGRMLFETLTAGIGALFSLFYMLFVASLFRAYRAGRRAG